MRDPGRRAGRRSGRLVAAWLQGKGKGGLKSPVKSGGGAGPTNLTFANDFPPVAGAKGSYSQ